MEWRYVALPSEYLRSCFFFFPLFFCSFDGAVVATLPERFSLPNVEGFIVGIELKCTLHRINYATGMTPRSSLYAVLIGLFAMLSLRQTPNPVLELEYLRPVNSNGRRLNRSVILHFLSMGEFVDAVMQDDFELGVSLIYAYHRELLYHAASLYCCFFVYSVNKWPMPMSCVCA